MVWPIATLPVKAMRRTFLCLTKASPATGPIPLSTLKTPGGRMSERISPMRRPDSGAWSGVFTTTVFPTISGISEWAVTRRGWLKGVIRATTP